MKPSIIFAALPFILTIVLVGSCGAFAASAPQYYGGPGGTISGLVISPTGSSVDWSQIYANMGNQTFEAFSGMSGFYLMRVPAGTYNVSVYDPYHPPYWAQSVSVTVTGGSSTTLNFYLQQQTPSPVPEFPDFSVLAVVLGFAMACLLARRLKRP